MVVKDRGAWGLQAAIVAMTIFHLFLRGSPRPGQLLELVERGRLPWVARNRERAETGEARRVEPIAAYLSHVGLVADRHLSHVDRERIGRPIAQDQRPARTVRAG